MKDKFPRVMMLFFALIAAFVVIPSALALFTAEDGGAAPTADPQVTVAHLAPFAATAADTSVTVRLNGGDAITGFEFGDIVNTSLPAGSYLVEIVPDGTSTVAISGTVNLADDTSYTLAAVGDGVNQPLGLLALVDDTTPAVSGAKMRVAHAAPFASGAAAVDICTDSGSIVVGDFIFNEVTDPYLALPAGDYDLQISVAGTNCATVALDLPSLRLGDGDIVDVFAIGGANGWPLDVTTTTGLTFTPAQVAVAHFAPFADTAVGTSVTVRLNGGDALTAFEFGDIANVELDAGEYLVEILPSGTSTVAISGTATLDPAGDYTIAAIGDGVNQPLELLVIDNNMMMRQPDAMASVFVAHLAPFAASGTEVDICTDDGAVIVPDFAYKDMAALPLAAGDYDLLIALAGTNCTAVALDLPSIRLGDGEMIDLFAIGGANGWPLSGASTTGFTVTPDQATVNVAHFAPFATEVVSTSVTVRLNGADAITDFTFGQLVQGVNLDPGDYLIEIVPTGASDPAITTTVTLSANVDYTVAAIGDGANQPLELAALVDDNSEPITGTARVRIAHYAPFAMNLADTQVDICTDSGVVVVPGVPFKGVTDPYLELPAGIYDLQVTAAGTDCGTLIFDIAPIALQVGQVASIFAVGGANGFAPTVITTPDLTPVTLYLPFVIANP